MLDLREGDAFGQLPPPHLGELFLLVALGFFVRDGEQQRGAQAGEVVGVAGFAEVGEVVSNLISDTEIFAILAEHFGDLLVLAEVGGDGAEPQGDLECGRGFLPENIEHLHGLERLGVALPNQLRALAAAEVALAVGGDLQHRGALFGGKGCFAEETIAFADEQIADVQRHGEAVFFVQSFFTVTLGVFVLDVVVDERGFVETLDGDGDFFEIIGNGFRGIIAQGLIRRHAEKRSPAFAGAREPVAANGFGFAFALAHNSGERFGSEPRFHFVVQPA